jgi:hypothetical protein
LSAIHAAPAIFAKKGECADASKLQDTLSLSSVGCAKAELQVSKVKLRLSTA